MKKTETPASGGKLKRKDPHPVRKEFMPTSDTQYKCMHCSWVTCMNATRMVKHIVEQCQNVPDSSRDEMATIQQAALEKERNSSFLNENKKDIHGLFKTVDTKRVCMFCDWSTVRNLTRMRNHIALQCPKVPLKVRACFLKEENAASEASDQQEQEHVQKVESYQVVTLDEGQWGEAEIQIVNTNENLEEEDQLALDDNYLEVQELEERNCCWCGKALTYASCEVEDGSEVFCSAKCFQLHNEHILKTAPSDSSPSPTPPPSQKRRMPPDSPKSAQAPPKQIKLVVMSGPVAAQETNVKQEACNSDSKTENLDHSASESCAMIEVINYSPEQDAESLPDQTPQQMPEEPVLKKVVQKSPAVPTTFPRKSPVKPRRLPPVAKPAVVEEATVTAATDEGSCHSYAGGHVYPQEDRLSADHKLQWTKAVISRPAPQFEATAVVEGAFKKIKLSDYRGKYLVFFFYPLDFTFVCPTEILAFSDRAKEFKKLNTEVIAASIDSHFTHLAWINTPRKEGGLGKINIPLVSDITHSIAKDYGVYLDDLGHTLRGLFIIDDRGILRQITMNDLPVGRSVDETLRLVQAFQYTDKHGEVCPAGWKPGQDTIVPNPEEKIKYFEKNH